jgi:hypothetical protein
MQIVREDTFAMTGGALREFARRRRAVQTRPLRVSEKWLDNGARLELVPARAKVPQTADA